MKKLIFALALLLALVAFPAFAAGTGPPFAEIMATNYCSLLGNTDFGFTNGTTGLDQFMVIAAIDDASQADLPTLALVSMTAEEKCFVLSRINDPSGRVPDVRTRNSKTVLAIINLREDGLPRRGEVWMRRGVTATFFP